MHGINISISRLSICATNSTQSLCCEAREGSTCSHCGFLMLCINAFVSLSPLSPVCVHIALTVTALTKVQK